MGAFFRSEEMVLCQLFLQSETAYSCVSELGELGLVQFRDLNHNVNAFQRKFVNELRRCEEMERKLRYVENEMNREQVEMFDGEDNPRAPFPREMIDLEAEFEKIEGELKEVHTNSEALQRNFLELTELKEVLKVSQVFFHEHERDYQHFVDDTNLSLTGEIVTQPGIIQLGFVAGVIQRERLAAFERLLWFACRGNAYLRTEEIPQKLTDPVTGDTLYKSVFIIFFQGEQLKSRVKKICVGFKAILYPCPESTQERQEMLEGVSVRLEDLQQVLSTTQMHRTRVLQNAAKELRHWLVKVRKIKAIYLTLDMCNFDMSPTNLVAEIWCPVRFMDDIRGALQTATDSSGGTVPAILHVMETDEMPPTYNRTNKFTDAYQEIVNAYGIAQYQEVNPALYFTITFPFLFSVMFGDAGHGVLMFLFGLMLVVKEKAIVKAKIQSDIFITFYNGRYLIMLMGLFAVYSGLIYNDVYSKSVNIFGTRWHSNFSDSQLNGSAVLQMNVGSSVEYHNPYTFGIDPIWQLSKNKISYSNSFKMKLSVILGVTQMVFGIILSIFNHVQFKRKINIVSVFLPEIIFLLSLFGYLTFLFYYKWLSFDCTQTQEAPALLMHLMNMMMFKLFGPKSSLPLSQQEFYHAQKYVQAGLLMLTLGCVPWLLFMKPCMDRRRHKQKKLARSLSIASRSMLINNAELSSHDDNVTVSDVSVMIQPDTPTETTQHLVENYLDGAGKNTDHKDEEFHFGEEMMHQLIHSIEFCLGCISHTASYLRLWALSLAHAELSEVLWTMVMRIGLRFDGWYGAIALVPLWAFWAVLTVCILLVMEGLSAFLHALRLHWIEFQTKFYVSDGYIFTPFTFKSLLNVHEEVL